MSITPLDSTSAITSTQFSSVSSINSGSRDTDGDNDGSRVSKAAGGGKFAAAITQALTQLGVTPTDASGTSDGTSSATASDPQQALASFMQNLFAALHAQGGQQATSNGVSAGASNSATSPVAGTSGHGHHHHGGGAGKLESGLQSLIQQLSSSTSQSGSDATSSGSSSSNAALDALQQSFSNLLSADGASGSNVSLSSFLQTLQNNVQGAPATGNVVHATA